MSGHWYARPVLSVRNASRSLEFYASKLGFKENWRHEEEGRPRIVQVSRQGCELTLSDQWPEEAGRGLMFISLHASDFKLTRQDWAERGVDVKSGWWGYDLLVVEDPDGNRLWFPHPNA